MVQDVHERMDFYSPPRIIDDDGPGYSGAARAQVSRRGSYGCRVVADVQNLMCAIAFAETIESRPRSNGREVEGFLIGGAGDVGSASKVQ